MGFGVKGFEGKVLIQYRRPHEGACSPRHAAVPSVPCSSFSVPSDCTQNPHRPQPCRNDKYLSETGLKPDFRKPETVRCTFRNCSNQGWKLLCSLPSQLHPSTRQFTYMSDPAAKNLFGPRSEVSETRDPENGSSNQMTQMQTGH